VDCLALSISLNFWLRWLLHEAWNVMRAQGLEFEPWLSQFILKIVAALRCPPRNPHICILRYTSESPRVLVSRHT
jgi:hypothetical protein